MELVRSCPICLDVNCACKTAITRFFSILAKVDARVSISSQNLTSSLPTFSNFAGVDKLNFTVLNPSEKLLKTIKLSPKSTLGQMWVYQLSNSVYVKQEMIRPFFITNPNRFGTLNKYFDYLESIGIPEDFVDTKISRLDLNLDFTLDYQTLIQSYNVKNKRVEHEFIEVSQTGIRSGRGNECIEIYNKSLKEKYSNPLTRIEVRLKGKKIPFKNLDDLKKNFVIKIGKSKVFENVELLSANVLSDQILPSSLHKKAAIIADTLKNDGFMKLRKKYNKNSNFSRDIGRILQTIPWPKQPNELYLENIQSFLGEFKKG